MFENWKKKKHQDENKISLLVTERDKSRQIICKLNAQMDALVQQAAEADELDRRIYSADYSTMKDQMLAEMQHFEDLSRLISQLRKADITRKRAAALAKLTALSETVDRNQLIANGDYVAARREMLAEEDESIQDAFDEQISEKFAGEDEEFTRLVARVKAENSMKSAFSDLPMLEAEKVYTRV